MFRTIALRNLFVGALFQVIACIAVFAQQPVPAKEIDLAPGCSNSCLVDSVSNNTYYSGGQQLGPQVSNFTIAGGYVLPSFSSSTISIYPPPNALGGGFTIALQMGPSLSPVENVFSIMDTSNRLLFSLLRDNQGRWYVGKERDNPTASLLYYISKTWDPVSPCLTQTCIKDTIYASFQTNGQIQLDEVAVLASQGAGTPADSYNWQSGLLNFGYPLTGFNVGGLTTDPTAPLQQWSIGGITLQTLYASTFYSPALLSQTTYPQAQIARLAMWSTTVAGGTGVLNSANQGIALDQASANANLNLLPQTNWINCGSGQFEQPKYSVTSPAQYWPAELPTPCNVPSAPLNITSTPTAGGAVTLNWTAPAFLGATNPGVTPAIQNYTVNTSVGGAPSPLNCTTSSISCVISGLSDGLHYVFQVAAQGMGGSTLTTPPVIGLSPAAEVVYISTPTAPGPPTGLAATPAATSAAVSWTAPSYTGGSLSSYNVSWTPITGAGQLNTPTTSATIPILTPNTTYTVTVQGVNNVGAGVPASTIVTTGPLHVPTSLSAVPNQNTVGLNWTAPDNLGAATAAYTVDYKPIWSSVWTEFATGSTSASIPNLLYDTQYTVTVSAAVNGVSSPVSAPANFVTAPGVPTNLNADAGVTTVNLTWLPPVQSNGLPIVGYVVTVSSPNNNNFYNQVTTNSTFVSMQGLPAGGTGIYRVTIQAYNQYYTGSAAGYVFFTMAGTPPTVNENGTSEGFAYCADEGGSCANPPSGNPTLVAYGATYGGADHYVFGIEPTTVVSCNAAHFFTNIAPPGSGIIYSCYTQSGVDNLNLLFPAPAGASFCAVEDTSAFGYSSGTPSTCNLPQPAEVAFGRGGTWTYKYIQTGGPFSCSTATFGTDPAPGQTKQCLYSYVNDPTAIGLQWCTSAPNACEINTPAGGNIIAYGVGYRFQYGIVSGWFWCQNQLFSPNGGMGSDPAPGATSGCFYNPASHVPPPPPGSGATYCASDNLNNHPNCLLPANVNRTPVIWYGTGSSYNSMTLPVRSQAINCDYTAFSAFMSDPSPGQRKSCWYSYE